MAAVLEKFYWSRVGEPVLILGTVAEHVTKIFLIDLIYCVYRHFQQYFSYYMSWRPVSVVEEAEVPGENHRPWASNW